MRWVTAYDKTLRVQEERNAIDRDNLAGEPVGFVEAISAFAIHELLFDPRAGNLPPMFPALTAVRPKVEGNAALSLVWIDPGETCYPPAALGGGAMLPSQLNIIRPGPKDLTWAAIECLRCKQVGAVVALLMDRPTRVEVRRLQLAAEQGGGVGVLMRPNLPNSGANIYAAATRWLVSPAPGNGRSSVGTSNRFTAKDGGHLSSWRNTVQQARHILCIHLPRWSITRFWRRRPEHRNTPVAVIQSIGQRRMVTEASDRARSQGVREGMSAAEAKALCGKLICIPQDLTGDRRSLSALGRWMMRFTPDVANGWDDATETDPAVLFLDLTGCERLFGGIEPIVQKAAQALAAFNIPAKLAVAPTPGAAWGFASSGSVAVSNPSGEPGRPRPGSVTGPTTAPLPKFKLTPSSNAQQLSALPITSLRIDETILVNLHRIGLHFVGDLLKIPRDQLLNRFGQSLLNRLDQLTGDRVELLTKLIATPRISARMEFDAPIEAVEEIGLIFEKLLDLVLRELTRRNHGVRQLRMILKPDRGWGRPTVTRDVALSRAHRHRATLVSLLGCEMERVDCENGFVHFQLDVPLHEPVTEAQTPLFEQHLEQEQMELDRLLQRLRARLGEAAIIRPELVESYLPERAWRPAKQEPAVGVTLPLWPRPLTLFQTPIEIRVLSEPSDDRTGHPRQFTFQGNVYRVIHTTGPERIAGEWWRGHHRIRDYYDVEDEAGRRFWIFRVLRARGEKVTARWFMHGRFD